MVDIKIVIKIASILNYGCALLMAIDVFLRIFTFLQDQTLFFYLMTFYLAGFAVVLVIAEMRFTKIIFYMEFMKGRLGKGIYLIIIALLIFDEKRNIEMCISLILVVVGFFNIMVSTMREKYREDFRPLRRDLKEDDNIRKQFFREERMESRVIVTTTVKRESIR
jgi:hypothetical protein